MAELEVDPRDLEDMAKKQDGAAEKSGEAKGVTSGVETAVWVTHGVISGASNTAFTAAEKVRRGAAHNIEQASIDLAAKLRAAKETYEGVDADLSANIKKQVLDR
jgi:uncharacterized protein YukE